MRTWVAVPILAFILQQTTTPPPTFRAGTRLVQVSVLVHDKHGAPVGDLKKGDFTLSEGGKPQDISFFSADSVTGVPAAAKPPSPANTFTNAPASRSDVPTNLTAILIDVLNSAVADQMRARDGLLKFLKQIKPQDRIAIYAMTAHGLALLHDYTSDSAALLERMQRARPQAPTTLDASMAAVQGDLRAMGLDAIADGEQRAADFAMGRRIDQSLSALSAIADHLAGLPGRKNLVWLSSGFPTTSGMDEPTAPAAESSQGASRFSRDPQLYLRPFDNLIRTLNDAGIAVYPVDARGVFNPGIADTSSRTAPQRWNEMPNISAQNANTSSMAVLASKTGGRFAYSTNDAGAAVRRAIDDAQVTYTLGYYPADRLEDGKWRDIKVAVRRPGVEVRARAGYFARAPSAQRADTGAKDIRNAVWSPLESTALPVTAVAALDGGPPATLQIDIRLDPRSVSFVHEGDRWKAHLDMVFVQKDAHGKAQGEGGMDALAIALSEESYKKMLDEGLLHRYRAPRQPTASTLRIVVRDAGSGSVGSVTIPLAQIRP